MFFVWPETDFLFQAYYYKVRAPPRYQKKKKELFEYSSSAYISSNTMLNKLNSWQLEITNMQILKLGRKHLTARIKVHFHGQAGKLLTR